jgi:hypothetical protein
VLDRRSWAFTENSLYALFVYSEHITLTFLVDSLGQLLSFVLIASVEHDIPLLKLADSALDTDVNVFLLHLLLQNNITIFVLFEFGFRNNRLQVLG